MEIGVITIPQEILDKVDIEIYGSLEAAKKAKKEEEKLWCKCKTDSISPSYYVPDNSHPQCDKHHWRCKKCRKITQIG